MKAEKALELVESYSSLTKQIKDCKKRIGDNLSLCNGISGHKLNLQIDQPEPDSKGRDTDLHLTQWYAPERVSQYGGLQYQDISCDEHGEECPHCYAAHLAIQDRKEARKRLGYVKAVMSRGIVK